jgi:hypothetical protein
VEARSAVRVVGVTVKEAVANSVDREAAKVDSVGSVEREASEELDVQSS